MPSRLASLPIVVALALGPVGQAPTRPSVVSVRVDVTVQDASRRVIENLTADDFIVVDNGVSQRVDDVTFGKMPIDIIVGIDISSSVSGRLLDRLRRAVSQLAGGLKPGERLKLMLFSQRVNRTVDFTTDASAINRAMRSASAGGAGGALDALSTAMTAASPPDRRQLIVFLTDGNETGSTTTPDALNTAAERTRATVSFVIPQPSTRPSSTLQRLATDTGGSLVIASSPDSDVGLSLLRVIDTFRQAYVLSFSPRGVDRGGFHLLAVGVRTPGAVVQGRRGYFGG